MQEGQQVKKGDVVGLVGNTGNAKYTPSHLHFGVYTFSGAINPLPFVNRTVKTAPAIAGKGLANQLKLKKAQVATDGSTVKAAAPLVPLAVDANGYLAEGPAGKLLHVPFAAVKTTAEPVRKEENLAGRRAENSPKS